MSDLLVSCSGVGKKFCRDLKLSLWYGLQHSLSDLAMAFSRTPIHEGNTPASRDSLHNGEFWANRDITFELRRGEALGLIGRNGAGKTTLLKLLSGLIKPDAGEIRVFGRVGALIALGAGFSPVLSGRENVYVNGSVLGFSVTEIDGMLDEIVEFSQLEDAIDSPVRTYSSGMTARLGFAIASAIKPDLLLVDEVLAVGDAAFRTKCYRKMGSLLQNGSAIILVSHGLSQVTSVCNKGLLLDRGVPQVCGTVSECIESYLNLEKSEAEASPELKQTGDHSDVSITGLIAKGEACESLIQGENALLIINLESASDGRAGYFSVIITGESQNGVVRVKLTSRDIMPPLELKRGRNAVVIRMEPLVLATGWYTAKVAFATAPLCVDSLFDGYRFFVRASRIAPENTHFQPGKWSISQ